MKLNRETFATIDWCRDADKICKKLGIYKEELTRDLIMELLSRKVNFIGLLSDHFNYRSQRVVYRTSFKDTITNPTDCNCTSCLLLRKYGISIYSTDMLYITEKRRPKTIEKYNKLCAYEFYEMITGEEF